MFRCCQEKKMGSSFVVAAEESCGGIQVCGIEEIKAKWWMDGASKHIVDGRFQSALSLLRKAQQLCPTLKGLPELTAISQVCYAGSWRACSCSSRRELCQTPDWYRILEVDENVDANSLKKRYRQLALLLHPDKNDHVNSEGAFKLVSKAYECLSDNHKRHTFNLERSKSFCVNCSLPPLNTCILAVPQTNRATYACQSHLVTVTDNTVEGKQDAQRLEILQERERARARVSMLDKEWGSRHSKWLQQLASVREKFQTYQYDLIPPPKSRTAYAHHQLFSSLHSQFHWSEGEYKRNVATSVTDLSLKSTLPAQARSHHMCNDSHPERPRISNNLLSRLQPKSEAAFRQAC
ncbi:hypothetical protein CY35_05G144700 [Sphagnum magellanicum]|nr:hypothetical protein CY35_05G144700 [Sphagnum magellanicum]